MPFKLNIGDGENYLKWTGFKLEVKGDILGGTISGTRLKVGGGTNEDIYFEDSGIRLYDANSNLLYFSKTGLTTLCITLTSTIAILRAVANNLQLESGIGSNVQFMAGTLYTYFYHTGQWQLPNLGADPTEHLAAGQLAIVNNVLRIYNGASWSNV